MVSLVVPSSLNVPVHHFTTRRIPVLVPLRDFGTMMITGTGVTVIANMEADTTESLEERSGTGGVVQNGGVQTVLGGVNPTMTEDVCHRDTAAENAIGTEMIQVHPLQTDIVNTLAIAQAAERESAAVWKRIKRGELMDLQAVEKGL